MEKIKVQGGMEKEKKVIVRHKNVSPKWKGGLSKIFHGTGTRMIRFKKEKQTPLESLFLFSGRAHMRL